MIGTAAQPRKKEKHMFLQNGGLKHHCFALYRLTSPSLQWTFNRVDLGIFLADINNFSIRVILTPWFSQDIYTYLYMYIYI